MMASGNHRIVYCGQQSYQIAQLLQSIWVTIQEAIESIDSAGPAGTTLYNTFFNGVDPNTVKGVLERVATGASIPFNGGARNPTIVCDNPSVAEAISSDAHAECQNVRGLMALWIKQSNTVFLCPKYLTTSRPEPVAKHCVGYLPSGAYSTGIMLAETQWSVLFHELVHLYLNVPYLENEARGIFAAIDLPASQSAINIPSYTFFLASMWHHISYMYEDFKLISRFIDIKAGCTTYKPKDSLRPLERQLLDNSTSCAQALATDEVVSFDSITDCADGSLDVELGLCPGKKPDVVFDLEPSITSGYAVNTPTGMSTSYVASLF